MKRKLWNGAHKVYIASMEKDGETYLKVGTTSYLDALDRFNYSEEKHPIRKTFSNITICASWTFPNKQFAKEVERYILDAWGPIDFKTKVYRNGITDMRRYTPQRYAIAKATLNKLRK